MQERATVPPKVRDLIRSEVGKAMKAYRPIRIEVDAAADHDGDPILVIEAAYRLSARPIDPAELTRLISQLRDRLWRMGETRFPHVRHHFADGQKVVGYDGIDGHGTPSRKGKTKQSKTS
jgi:hypothetical protein